MGEHKNWITVGIQEVRLHKQTSVSDGFRIFVYVLKFIFFLLFLVDNIFVWY